MLFNSYIFVIAFLPIALAGYWVLWNVLRNSANQRGILLLWLIGCSAIFYAAWSVKYLGLLVLLMSVNYAFGRALIRRPSQWLVVLGVGFNLITLGYFKYANFFLEQIDLATGANITLNNVVLPLGISFFTFQKIAYLVDAYRGEVVKHSWRDFSLFVLFFPQLIAGPIVHQKEILPQLTGRRWHPSIANVAIGISIFSIGLFKKVVLADGVALTASPVFDDAALGHLITFGDAWIAVLSYTLQIYFDFSGYSDMAIGLARLFGIRLPINFDSPYKASSIIDFWRRWHITLSRFLRDYLYFPLGGSRVSSLRRYGNLLVVMLLGGLWHGASWTFVIWGAIHGCLLMINHLWRDVRERLPEWVPELPPSWGAILTFASVALAWIFFRSSSFDVAKDLLASIIGMHGVPIHNSSLAEALPVTKGGALEIGRVMLGYLIVFIAPNTQELFARYNPALVEGGWRIGQFAVWRLNGRSAAIVGIIFAVAFLMMGGRSEFIYYQF